MCFWKTSCDTLRRSNPCWARSSDFQTRQHCTPSLLVNWKTRTTLTWNLALAPNSPVFDRFLQPISNRSPPWTDFPGLHGPQRFMFFSLSELLHGHFERLNDPFDNVATLSNCHWPTWLSVLVDVAKSIINPAEVFRPIYCWFSTFQISSKGWPRLSVKPGYIERCAEGNHAKETRKDGLFFGRCWIVKGSSPPWESPATMALIYLVRCLEQHITAYIASLRTKSDHTEGECHF